MMDAETFVDLFGKEKQGRPLIQYGVIASPYTGGRPKIIFGSEGKASGKRYPYLSSYTPVAGDRVQIVNSVVQGKII